MQKLRYCEAISKKTLGHFKDDGIHFGVWK